jgi:hypothetical protein
LLAKSYVLFFVCFDSSLFDLFDAYAVFDDSVFNLFDAYTVFDDSVFNLFDAYAVGVNLSTKLTFLF